MPETKDSRGAWAFLLSAGMEFALIAAASAFLGRFLGLRLGIEPWGTAAGTFLGLSAAFARLVIAAIRAGDDERRRDG